MQPCLIFAGRVTSGLYYKHMTIVNDDSSVVSEQSLKLIDDARGVIYDRHMFIIQATMIFKNHPIFQKVAQQFSKPKKVKISTTKLKLKAQNIASNHF